jgi:hypothetical protein
VLEPRPAIAEIAASSGNRSEAPATARDAAQAGFGLIAAKANMIAQPVKSKQQHLLQRHANTEKGKANRRRETQIQIQGLCWESIEHDCFA